MRIHTDTLTAEDLWRTLPEGCDLELMRHGSRKRDHAYEVKLTAEPGTDRHGIKRAYTPNTGNRGAGTGYGKAATYIEWGDWMVELLKIDNAAIIGPYDGASDFLARTAHQASWRQERENAPAHAKRWAVELGVEQPFQAVAHF